MSSTEAEAVLPPPPPAHVNASGEAQGTVTNSASSSSVVVKRVRPARLRQRTIPQDILENTALMEAIKLLPANYNFEIPKILWRIRQGREEEEEKVAKEQRMKKQQEYKKIAAMQKMTTTFKSKFMYFKWTPIWQPHTRWPPFTKQIIRL